ncbi:MAG TPA: class F sortase [Candidatus Saccharimonadales bacterium]|nr:class F sortase [Candidatus Saccharimonadales bacterium]
MSLRIGEKVKFYSLIGFFNLAIGVMFYVINITPAPVLASVPPPKPPVVVQAIPATKGIPTRVIIPSLTINLPVGIGTYNQANDSWTLDTTKAYFADSSMPVNNSNGTTLIYGHAQSPVFATLPQIKTGATAQIHTDTGYVFHYRYIATQTVEPNNTTVFTSSGPPKLVLQTCTGNWSEYRALFSFKLESIEQL